MLAKRSMPQSGLPVVPDQDGGKDGGYEMRQKSEQIGDEQPLCEMGGILGLQRYDSKHRIDDHEQQDWRVPCCHFRRSASSGSKGSRAVKEAAFSKSDSL